MSGNSGPKNEEKNMFDTSGDDFATPVVFKKFKKSGINPKTVSNKCKIKKSSKKRQVTLHQMVKQNLQYSDVNPEHLQMALALSRSISDDKIDNTNGEIPWASDEQKYEKRRTLLEFGFKSNKIKMSSENKMIKKDTWRTNKKSKFRFITPILYLRSEEDRESLVQSKLSLILSQNIQENSWEHEELDSSDIMSEELFKINCSDCCIFRLNHKFNEFSRLSFSVPDLNILENRTKCGFLLKDWKNIPLRDHSPDRLEAWNKKSSRLENKIEFCQRENLQNCENKANESTINELNPEELGNSTLIIHKKIDSRDITLSPDLFEDASDGSISESYSSKAKKNLKKLFSEVNTLEKEIPLVTNMFSSNPAIFDSESPVEKKILKDSIGYPNDTCHHISENIVISSSSDEEGIEKYDQKNTNGSKRTDLHHINSIEEKYLEKITRKLLQPVPMQNIHNLGIKSGLANHYVSTEYTNHHMDLNLITTLSKLDEKVFISNSNKHKEFHETKMNNIDCQLQDISYSGDETNKVNSSNELINSIISPTSEENFQIINPDSNDNLESVVQNNLYRHQKQCSSDMIEIDNNIIGELLPNEKKKHNSSSIDDNVKYTKIYSFNNDNSITKNNLFTSGSLQSSLISIIDDCEKLDNISVCKTISESYKDVTSLNVTEHIEKMLACSYSPITSINISDEESNSSLNKQTENLESGNFSISNSSADQQNLLSTNSHPSEGNSQHSSLREILCSPTFDEHIFDEEINYSNNIRTNEKSLNKNNENIELLKETETIGRSYRTPLRRYASFTESSSAKENAAFGRYKSESDITPKRKFIVKTDNITPMVNYAELDTPSIVKELSKYGLKPLKRKRGVNLLKHIYEATHPIVESKGQPVDGNKVLKKTKMDKCEIASQKEESIISDNQVHKFYPVEPWTETIYERDLIFERQRSSRIPNCQIPLQIVWHNFLVQNPEIRENILLYEPLQVDIVSKMLKEQGFKFHLQDLLTFLDRKCITIKIPQNHNNVKS